MTSVLLLHGAMLNKEMWLSQIDDLGVHFNVHSLDMPGHGERSSTPFTLDAAIEEVHRYVESNTNGRITIVGLSLGGYVAVAYSQKHQDKIKSLVLSGCCVQYVGLMGLIAGFVAWFNPHFLKHIGTTRFESKQRKNLLKVASPKTVKSIVAGVISTASADFMRDLVGKDFIGMTGQCKIPILLVNGQFDKLNRKYEPRYSEVCYDLTIETIEGSGHLCNLERPEEFSRLVVKFIASNAQ